MTDRSKALDVCCELDNGDISELKERVLQRILKDKAFELLPYYGFLYFKDKIWRGRVFRVDSQGSKNESRAADGKKTLYLLEMNFIFIKEMEGIKVSEDVLRQTSLTVFDLNAGSDSQRTKDANVRLWENCCYFVKKKISDCISNQDGISALDTPKRRFDLLCLRGDKRNDIVEDILGKGVEFKRAAFAFFAVLEDASSDKFKSTPCQVNGYTIRAMSLNETLYAVRHWKFADDGSLIRFSASWSNGLVIGAFPEQSTTPVSWAFVSWDGAIAALQTLPEHRGKGLGKAVVKSISEVMLQRSLIPYVFIEDIETAFIPASLFTSLGFSVYNGCHYSWLHVIC